jgi:1,4-alpha-glucan branching enzyme
MAKTKQTKKMIQFALEAPHANRVSLAGSFNKWDTKSLSAKKDKSGIWKVQMSLPRGRHEYKFFVDGQWQNDPRCSSCVTNQFGSTNCIVEVK